jgi:hypothetical protein
MHSQTMLKWEDRVISGTKLDTHFARKVGRDGKKKKFDYEAKIYSPIKMNHFHTLYSNLLTWRVCQIPD